MNTPSFKEDHISQVPALQLLMKLGYTYLSQDEALELRGNKKSGGLLEEVLRKQLKEINNIKLGASRTAEFSASNIESGIQALKDLPMNEGYINACEHAYNLLTLGKSLEQSIDGDKKSFTLQYIDWQNIRNNVFHVTEEFEVLRTGSREHYRPDLVLFVNGIPLCIIECKRPDIRESLTQAISQHLRNQQEDGIRQLYVYAQLLLSTSVREAVYATNGTSEKFWAAWKEKYETNTEENFYRGRLESIINSSLPREAEQKLFKDRFRYVKKYFEEREAENILATQQDDYLYGLCRPERLLDLAFNFIVFDDGEKKIARYQQFFAIKKAMAGIGKLDGGRRKGGVIWHTQGSGKSLTMVMLAQAIALDKTIRNPKIILVTDRVDLDNQITGTFRKCGIPVNNASTGQRLVELLESKSDAVITTVINKFEAAVRKIPRPLEGPDIFVLVDEGHRSQHGSFNIHMQKTLPNACFIAMTGTPLFKKDKSTAARFGGIIDMYTVDMAVKDKAVVPLLYEGRHAFQQVNEKQVDTFFSLVSEPLNPAQRADLKKKFSRADQLNIAEQKIYAICWDLSHHFRDNFQHRTPFKAQLVCQSKEAAIKYKYFLDEIGIVSSEVLISPPDDREGEDSAYGETSDRIKSFWKKRMDEHGNSRKYEKHVISRFKNQQDPEIIIVVDKLLTGFDEPKNTVLYLTRNLKGHTLLQAIARVNRVYPDKDYGYIIDYYGVIEALDTALDLYSSFEDFDAEDLDCTLLNITEEIEKLPQRHSELRSIFKTIRNKVDAEAYQQLLGDDALRIEFYEKLAAFARVLKMALSSVHFHQRTPVADINMYKEELGFFLKLRNAVIQRFSDNIDYKQYEGQIQKLIDTHILTDEVRPITRLVNIFDKEQFQMELAKTDGDRAKADKIASRTSKHISEKMDEDPAFYKKFSEMLKEAIRAFEEHRIGETQYLQKVTDLMEAVLNRREEDLPAALQGKDVAKAFYGIASEGLQARISDDVIRNTLAADVAISSDEIIRSLMLVDWQNNIDVRKRMLHQIGDYIIDEVRDKHDIDLSFEEIDGMADRMIEVAKIRYR